MVIEPQWPFVGNNTITRHDTPNGGNSDDLQIINVLDPFTPWCRCPLPMQEMLVWQNIVISVLETYTERTNGSYIQRKSTALAWHYENADPQYGDMQAVEAERYLKRIVESNYNVAVQRYDHVRMIEVVPKEIHKG